MPRLAVARLLKWPNRSDVTILLFGSTANFLACDRTAKPDMLWASFPQLNISMRSRLFGVAFLRFLL